MIETDRPAHVALRRRGLARRIYAAFLLAAVIPTAVAGVIGVFYSLNALRTETLRNLTQEVGIRAQGVGRFFDQLSSEMLYLADNQTVSDLAEAVRRGGLDKVDVATKRLERDFSALASVYPHIYQIRFLDSRGREVVRVDRRNADTYIVPKGELQDKSDRYYVRDALKLSAGQIYVSPLDLNVEFGRVEKPERPVIRVATPIASSGKGYGGLLIVNLHADILIEQIQQMTDVRGGVAYLFDRSGHYLSRSAENASQAFEMQPVDHLPSFFGTEALARITKAEQGTEKINGWIVAHASIDFAKRNPDIPGNWVIALAFPERSLFTSVFNLYLLYAVLSVALLATAVGGYAISRHLLEPLEELHHEASAIAAGDFSRRVAIRGNDEIGALGDQFNNMAERIDDLVKSLAAHRDRLEDEVKARTQDLEREQDKRRELDRQMFQTEKMATMGELAMGVAHEIGNPLAGMKAVVQSMQFKKDLPPSIRPPLQRLEAEIDRLTSFLRTFHGLAAPEITHREECLLVALLDDVLFWTRKEAQTRGVAIDCKGVDELPALWADPQQFRQILLNLVLNAIHAMPDGGHIAIRAHFEGDRARIEVADSGHGIPADVMPHIFDPFFTTRSNGTGLGLSIVRKIAEQHAARIDVDSEIGHGACFTLLWPLASVTM